MLEYAADQNLRADIDPVIGAEVVLVSEIPKTRRGKHRWIVNEYRNGLREQL